ncbi:hypothetical protein T05_12041 [Trichinella murrelli]|uniref:Uncharacterized protein n=1 Tax=Trichinella murrelli TaxID=144512 RepID=A0A0V0U7R3_9BILA|nr:hypothetical protein T05_12041 [Trichinella murrelli]
MVMEMMGGEGLARYVLYHCLESVFGEILLDMVFEKRFALFLLLMGNYEQMNGEIDDGRRHLQHE